MLIIIIVVNDCCYTKVTYMLNGSFKHEDFCGHKGTINTGDLQVLPASSINNHNPCFLYYFSG